MPLDDEDAEIVRQLHTIKKGDHPLEVEEKFQVLLERYKNNFKLKFIYNEFRIANASHLPRTRPQILLGGPIGLNYPNIHSYFLFEVADVVCLTCVEKAYSYTSAIHCSPNSLFFEILTKLPPGFHPDFYWDNQIEHRHYIPPGIEIAPFPIVASVCHTFLHKSIEYVCELFDKVISISSFHGDLLRKKYGDKVIDIPFGINWASFNRTVEPQWDNKSIDLCVTFSEHTSPAYANKRNQLLQWVREFNEKHPGRFSIEFLSDLTMDKYLEVLKKSRITLNITGVHGSYNYRTLEAISTGSMVFQYDWDGDFFENKFSDLFQDEVHGAGFNKDSFEKKLLYYLENPEITQKIAKTAHVYLEENYSYKKLYEELIRKVKESSIQIPRKITGKQGYFLVDMIYYYQNSLMQKNMVYGVLGVDEQESWIRFNNLMILTLSLDLTGLGCVMLVAEVPEPLSRLKHADLWNLCQNFYQSALASVPLEYLWIVRWNYFLLSLEMKMASKMDFQEVAALLEKTTPAAFDETRIIFKYYVDDERFPEYNLSPKRAVDSIHPFTQLNIDLLKSMNNPEERARLHLAYAQGLFLKTMADTSFTMFPRRT